MWAVDFRKKKQENRKKERKQYNTNTVLSHSADALNHVALLWPSLDILYHVSVHMICFHCFNLFDARSSMTQSFVHLHTRTNLPSETFIDVSSGGTSHHTETNPVLLPVSVTKIERERENRHTKKRAESQSYKCMPQNPNHWRTPISCRHSDDGLRKKHIHSAHRRRCIVKCLSANTLVALWNRIYSNWSNYLKLAERLYVCCGPNSVADEFDFVFLCAK